MWKAIFFTATLAVASVILPGCSDEQDNQMGQDTEFDTNPEWNENPYGQDNAEDMENPEPTGEINRNQDDDDLIEPYPDDEGNSLDEATEQGVGQQY